MSKLCVVVDDADSWRSYYPSEDVHTFEDYRENCADQRMLQVINICSDYSYLGKGYYATLLAEARMHKVIPNLEQIGTLENPWFVALDLDEVETGAFQDILSKDGEGQLELESYFGYCPQSEYERITRRLFEKLSFPLMRLTIRRIDGSWVLTRYQPMDLAALTGEQEDFFANSLEAFSRKMWRKPSRRKRYRYDMAVLHAPDEKMPPSNPKALKAFISNARKLGIHADLVTHKDYARLAEYDALFIRETTSVTDHTFRFAQKAEQEGLVVVDDPTSILRCTNKVFIGDLLNLHHIATPMTELVSGAGDDVLDMLENRMGYPVVLKIPDGSFSTGVFKAEDRQALKNHLERMLVHSHFVIAQEYVYTEFDWRIGVFGRKPIFACQYFMARGHWQIYNHNGSHCRCGNSITMPVHEAPSAVVRTALRAASKIGDGLYGVDIKQVGDRIMVVEINDNPSIDAGVEDKALGEDLYRNVMFEFLSRLERYRNGGI